MALVVAALVPAAAGAHGGFQVMAATKGAYSVTVRARPFIDGGQSKIDVTSYVVRQDLGESDLTAKVQLHLTGPNGSLDLTPPVVGDGFESIINAPATAWRHWTITAHVSGPAGTTTVVGQPVGNPPGAPTWLIPASILVVLIAGGLMAVGRRRRAGTAAGADSGDEDDDWDPIPTELG